MARVITNSELGMFQRCRRAWWLSYYRKLRQRRFYSAPLSVGSLVHRALEEYYDPEKGGDPQTSILERARAAIEAAPEHADAIASDAELAGIMVSGYLDWLAEEGADANLEVYAAEQTIAVSLDDDHVLQGKLDARAYRRTDGARLFLEHKTVANLANLPKGAQLNPQFLTYHLLEYLDPIQRAVEAERTDGVILNMLRKVKRTARANPPFYGRHEVRFNRHEIQNHWKHVLSIALEIDQATARLDAGEDPHDVCPPNPPGCCGRGWGSDFILVCPLLDDGSDAEAMLKAEYEEHDPMERYEEEVVDE